MTIRTLSTRGRSRAKPTEIVVFVTAALLIVDLVLTGLVLSPGRMRGEAAQLLDWWDLVKAGLAGLLLLAVAYRLKSLLPVAFGVVLLAIGLQDETGWHAPAAQWMVDRFDLASSVADIPTPSLVEAAILSALALIFVVAILVMPARSERLRALRRWLLVLLGLLFVFSVGVDLLTDATANLAVMRTEEIGERLTLTVVVGYAAGQVVGSSPRNRLRDTG